MSLLTTGAGAGSVASAPPSYTPQGVLFNNSVFSLRAQFTGIADSKVGTFSGWVFFPTGLTDASIFQQSSGSGGEQDILLWSNSNTRFNVHFSNAAGTTILNYVSTNGGATPGNWYHVLMSWDLSIPRFQFYVNDVADTGSFITPTVNDTINYSSSGGQWIFNIPTGGTNGVAMADVWFDPTSSMDLSVTANRRKFISASGSAVSLGSSGQLPTGSSPISFNTGPFGGWNTNLGTGGNYTTTGSLAASATNPP